MDVSTWLRGLGLERYRQAFEANDVDARTLRLLTQADLIAIGVTSVGHRRKLIEAIAALKQEELPEPPGALPSVSLPAERRQLSVLYCDLTTELLHLPPENMRDVVRSFHEACTAVVAAHDGHTANFYGDRLLAYFGWPQAHEDDVERAVRAALALTRQIPRLSASGQALSARAGVATGDVVVGDLIHQGPAQEQSAVGLTPNLGARLLGIAAPGQVVIDELTRDLLPPSFALLPLGSHTFRGLGEAVTAFGVVEELPAESRFDARKGADLAPMIGRDQELDLLLERWRQAQAGEGQAVLLVGEAGIGKSRLTRALLDSCAQQPHTVVRWQCSPHHTGSALWPVIQRLSHAAGLQEQDSAEQALDKLEATVDGGAEAAALYATLLGLNGSQRYGPLEMTPQMLRERMLELMVEQLYDMAEQRALLLVIEDVHWIDPSTLELLGRCLERISGERVLILTTSRPDNQPSLSAHPSMTRLSLNRLGRASVESMIARLGGGGLASQTLTAIVARTDGVPLFVEELTKAVLETGEAAIPASLHGSLMARLDRVPEVREVAQIAACIGREFDPELVRAVAERPEAVGAALDQLARAELVFRRGDQANPRYVFKHALVQDAAYQSLLRAHRQRLHGRILQTLQDSGSAAAEVLARHATGAGQTTQAIELWQRAGDAALGKSAYLEAAGHLGKAIELVGSCPAGEERRLRELALFTRLGQANAAGRGMGAPETKRAFECAYQIFDPKRDTAYRIPVLYGVWIGCVMVAQFARAQEAARELLASVQDDGDGARHLAHRLLGTSLLCLGEFSSARAHLERSLAVFDSAGTGASAIAAQTGIDPLLNANCWLAWVLALQGFADQATAALQRARLRETALQSANNRAALHILCALVQTSMEDPAGVARDATTLAELAAKYKLPMMAGSASCDLGWVALKQLRPDEAIRKYDEGLARLAASGNISFMPYHQIGRALALAACGRTVEARHVVEQAIVDSSNTGERWCAAELLRVRGELALQGTNPEVALAAESFGSAIDLARQQKAKLWELRAAVSFARLHVTQGRRSEALGLLAPVYDTFTEGFEAADLVQAREVLADLGHRQTQGVSATD